MADGTSTHVALCASCRVSPQPVTEDHAGLWRCPNCGATDTRDAIHADLREHLVTQAQQGLNDNLRDMARRSKFMTFKPGSPPRADFRWVTDFDLKL